MNEPAPSPASLELTVNGKRHELPVHAMIADLVREMVGEDVAVAVERNGAIVSRGDWLTTELLQNDRVELVRFVQGG